MQDNLGTSIRYLLEPVSHLDLFALTFNFSNNIITTTGKRGQIFKWSSDIVKLMEDLAFPRVLKNVLNYGCIHVWEISTLLSCDTCHRDRDEGHPPK